MNYLPISLYWCCMRNIIIKDMPWLRPEIIFMLKHLVLLCYFALFRNIQYICVYDCYGWLPVKKADQGISSLKRINSRQKLKNILLLR